MTDDTANRMWPTLGAATRRRPTLDISTRKKTPSRPRSTARLVMRLERPAGIGPDTAEDEVTRLRERAPGCAGNLFLVRRRG